MNTPERPLSPYRLTARFPDQASAGSAYGACRATIFASSANELSIFRLALQQIWHVAVLGLTPPAPLDREIRRALAAGIPSDLPADIWSQLEARRASAIQLGSWVERRLDT